VRHDHLFAFLGLAADASSPAFYTNCDMSVADAVEHYARLFLQRKGNIKVLYRASLQGDQLLAPSWVSLTSSLHCKKKFYQTKKIPNWYGAHEGFSFEYAEGLWDYPRRQMLPSFYNVAPGSNMKILDSSKMVFGLKGCRIDRIVTLANVRLQGLPEALITKGFLLGQKRLHAKESDAIVNTLCSYPTGGDPTEVHWTTLICNVAFDLTRAPADLAHSYRAWGRMQQHSPLALGSPEWRLQTPFRQVIDAYNGDKIFGLTENGYVGMFRWTSKAGDEIYLLFGGDFPFVVQKLEQKGYFQLVGQLDWKSYTSEAVYLAGPYGRRCSKRRQMALNTAKLKSVFARHQSLILARPLDPFQYPDYVTVPNPLICRKDSVKLIIQRYRVSVPFPRYIVENAP